MSKVIRISNETFSRLQNLAEPFVDTPASVIEKLLDKYESRLSMNNRIHEADMNFNVLLEENLFLAPADKKNIKLSIQKRVRTDDVLSFLNGTEQEELKSILKEVDSFNCWAMTESKRATFDSMKEGDLVLLSEKNTGKFNYVGSIKGKIESKTLGKNLWSFTPAKPWSLIYILDNLKSVNIDKQEMVMALGYNKSYRVPGVIKVQKESLESATRLHGDIEGLIDSLNRPVE